VNFLENNASWVGASRKIVWAFLNDTHYQEVLPKKLKLIPIELQPSKIFIRLKFFPLSPCS